MFGALILLVWSAGILIRNSFLSAYAEFHESYRLTCSSSMNETHFAITVLIMLLLVASCVAMAAKWIRVPYTLMLVIVGLIISPMHFLPVVHISPDLILLIFLPALLFDASWNLNASHLRANLWPILLLAVPGVGLAVGVIGVILHFGIGLAWSSAFLFGAMISATDPVSVLALFKKLNLPARLTMIIEGESLLNDGTSAVVFRIILGTVVGMSSASVGELFWNSLREFFLVIFGGITVGAIIGLLASKLTSFFDDHLLEITLTTIAAYGSVLLAEVLHVSPVIAVLATGLIIGNYGRQIGMSPTTQVAVNSFWEYAAFVVNSLVFLLIGLEIQFSMFQNVPVIFWAVLAMLVSRIVAVYGLMPILRRFEIALPFRWQHVLFWGGLRGSLSIALVLSLPTALPGRSTLVIMVFGAVAFSLLGQGLTMSPLMQRLKLAHREPHSRDLEILQAQLLAETDALKEVERLRSRGRISGPVQQRLHHQITQNQEQISKLLSKLDLQEPHIVQQELLRFQRHLLDVKKATLRELLREGTLSADSYHELIAQLDEDLPRKISSSDSEN
jgi:monovalent cation:H+ antiporter, CPA1 family